MALFIGFSLEEHVPQDYPLCPIDRFVDLNDMCQCHAVFDCHKGRPSAPLIVDPSPGRASRNDLPKGSLSGEQADGPFARENRIEMHCEWMGERAEPCRKCRLIEADAIKQNSTPKDNWDRSVVGPAGAPRDVMEYLSVLADAAFGAASDVEPKFTPRSDPSSQSAAVPKGPTSGYEKAYERVEARARAFFRNIMEKA